MIDLGADRPPVAPRVALVHDWLTGMRGGEKVLEAIAAHFPQAPIFTLLHVPGSVSPELERHEIRTSFLQHAPFAGRWYRSYLPLFPLAIEDLDLGAFDLVISTSHCVAKGVIPAPGAFHLCYCHSPMRYAWDQERAYFPKRTGLLSRARALVLSRLRTWDAASAPRVDLFVANSHFVAQRIRRYYGRTAEILHPPVALESFTSQPQSPSSKWAPDHAEELFCLSVAALSPYKRHDIAIDACKRLGMPLVIVGDGPDRRHLERLLVGSPAGTRLAGRVGDAELQSLYRRAAVFVQPATEDFGIAALEALASGTPVAAAAAGGVLDIVDDGIHGFLYDSGAGSVGLAQAIDKCRRFRSNSLDLQHRAAQFSRSRFDEKLLALLEEHLPRELHASLDRLRAAVGSRATGRSKEG